MCATTDAARTWPLLRASQRSLRSPLRWQGGPEQQNYCICYCESSLFCCCDLVSQRDRKKLIVIEEDKNPKSQLELEALDSEIQKVAVVAARALAQVGNSKSL